MVKRLEAITDITRDYRLALLIYMNINAVKRLHDFMAEQRLRMKKKTDFISSPEGFT
jgi:hypothetical protein